jgi:hypothetical protein
MSRKQEKSQARNHYTDEGFVGVHHWQVQQVPEEEGGRLLSSEIIEGRLHLDLEEAAALKEILERFIAGQPPFPPAEAAMADIACIGCGEDNYVAYNVSICGACKQVLNKAAASE